MEERLFHTPVRCSSQEATMLRLETRRNSRGSWMQWPLKELMALRLLNSWNPWICKKEGLAISGFTHSVSCPPSFFPSECARVFHTGGARLVLCGKSWERLQSLHGALVSAADPSKVRPSGSRHGQPLDTLSLRCLLHGSSFGEIWMKFCFGEM